VLPLFSDPFSAELASNARYHRGGEEVLMDVGGQDATDSFEVCTYFPQPHL